MFHIWQQQEPLLFESAKEKARQHFRSKVLAPLIENLILYNQNGSRSKGEGVGPE